MMNDFAHFWDIEEDNIEQAIKGLKEHRVRKIDVGCVRYKNKKGQKIVFIHGKGEGTLRRAILDELRTKYKEYSSQDASFREYGFGATMVTIA